MSAGPELRAYNANLNEALANIRDVRTQMGNVQDKIDLIEMAIDAVDTVERKADEFGDTIAKLKLSLKLMDKTGPLKALATLATPVLNAVERVARQTEEKAEQLTRKIDDSGLEEQLEAADAKLEFFDNRLTLVEATVAHDANAVATMIKALDTIDELDPTGDPGQGAAAAADTLAKPPNQAITAINDTYADVKALTQAMEDAVPSASFLPVLGVRLAFDKISSSLAFLRGPLDIVSKVLKPIEGLLDAVGFLYNVTVRPVVDYLLKTLGIDSIITSASNKITSILPNPGVLDNILADVDTAFLEIDPLGQLDDYLGISAWVDEINMQLLDPIGDPATGSVGIGSVLADILQSTMANDLLDGAEGNDTLLGSSGDSVLLAGAGNDLLDGGTGYDIAVFRGNFIEYSFAQNEQGGDIVFDHLHPGLRTIVDGSDITRNIERYTFADLSLTREQLLNSVYTASAGQTQLSGTDEMDVLFAANSAITIEGRGGNDVIVGSPENDVLRGGSGNDTIVRSGGNDIVEGDAGSDTWRFSVDHSSGNPDIDVDLERGSALVGGTTTQMISIENIVVEDNREAYLFGDSQANRFVGATDRDLLVGRAGDDLLDGGGQNDILIGGGGNDTLYGGAGNDTLVASELTLPGISNHYDGGEGDFDRLTYASDISDIVRQEYIDNAMQNKVAQQDASGPVRIFAETGTIERLSGDGSTVIATDTAISIEEYVGSDFNDELFGAAGEYLSLDGGAGNDILHGGLAGRNVSGGAGDDLIFAGVGGANYHGGEGYDILDLTKIPDVRWLIRLDGSLGSSLRAFNAVEGDGLAVPGGSLQNDWGPSLLASSNVDAFERYRAGEEDDYFELRSQGLIVVQASGGDDYLQGRNGGDNNPSFELYGEEGDDHIVLQETGNASGGEGNDRIDVDASASAHVTVQGDNGDDLILVRGGMVTIDGGTGYDVLSAAERNVLAGIQLDLAAGTIVAADNNNRFAGSIQGIEAAVGSDFHADILRGSDNGETLVGAGGEDMIEGRGEADALYGGADDDQLFGGDGDDLLHGGPGNDLIDGGTGIDTASWVFAMPSNHWGESESSSFGHLDVDLSNGVARVSLFTGGTEVDTLVSIENVTGGKGDDTIHGDGKANLLAGGEGADMLDGRGGHDVLILDGNDTAFGGDGDDHFTIGLGNVTIDGGSGRDVLDFGTLDGTLQIDIAAGSYEAMFEIERPVWRLGGGTEARNTGNTSFTPQQVLETDPAFANSLDDTQRVVPADPALEIDLVTTSESAHGNFTYIEQFVGGTSLDTAVFQDARSRYALSAVDEGMEITTNNDHHILIGIERLHFADTQLALDLDGHAGQVAKLLGAVFGRESVSNKVYAGIGLELMDGGMSYEDLAALAIEATGKATPNEIVTLLWTNVVGSPPSTEQAQPYVDMLAEGTSTGALGVLAAETELNAANINLVGLASTGLDYV